MHRCMRTTITLDDDVAALVTKIQRSQRRTLKDVVNAGLREGLQRLDDAQRRPRPHFRTKPLGLGPCRIGSIDDISEVLAIAEGEAHR